MPPQQRLRKWHRSTLFISLLVFLTLAAEIAVSIFEVTSSDQKVVEYFVNYRTETLSRFMIALSFLGSYRFLLPLCLIACLTLIFKNDRVSLYRVLVAGIAASVVFETLKRVFQRSRPDHAFHLVEASGFSFPSGHSFGSAVIYFTLAGILWHFPQKTRSRLILLFGAFCTVAAIGFSRIYLGVHYPSDVLGGISLGTTFALLITLLFPRVSQVQTDQV